MPIMAIGNTSGQKYGGAWYCNGSLLAGWLGCPETPVPSAQDQLDMMRGNFGGHSDPTLVNQAVNDFGVYLDNTGYDQTIKSMTNNDPFGLGINWQVLLIGAFVIGFGMSVLDSGPRRYGR